MHPHNDCVLQKNVGYRIKVSEKDKLEQRIINGSMIGHFNFSLYLLYFPEKHNTHCKI